MNRLRLAGIAVTLAALFTASSFAQPAGQPSTPPDQRQAAPLVGGTAQKSQNNWRGRTLIGTPVFNDSGQRIATLALAAPDAGTPAFSGDLETFGAILLGATRDSLAKMEAFRFSP